MAPPKQSTLGYVKPSQRKLTCVAFFQSLVVRFRLLIRSSSLSKFFGGPNGAKSAPQQSKLAFSTKAQASERVPEKKEDDYTNGELESANKDVEMEDAAEAKDEPEILLELKAETMSNGTNGAENQFGESAEFFAKTIQAMPKVRPHLPQAAKDRPQKIQPIYLKKSLP